MKKQAEATPPHQLPRLIASLLALLVAGFRIFELPNALNIFSYYLFPCQLGPCEPVGLVAITTAINIVAIPLLIIGGVWLLLRPSRIALLTIALGFMGMLAFAIYIFSQNLRFPVNSIMYILAFVGLGAAILAWRDTQWQAFKLSRRFTLWLSIGAAISIGIMFFLLAIYRDQLVLNRYQEIASAWTDDLKKFPAILLKENVGRRALPYSDAGYSYKICMKLQADTRVIGSILGTSAHPSGEQCQTLPSVKDQFLHVDSKVDRHVMISALSKTDLGMQTWTSEPPSVGTPYITSETAFQDSKGNPISHDDLRTGNIIDIYWLKDDYYKKEFVYKVVLTGPGPLPDLCEKAILTDNSSSAFCPTTTTNLTFVEMADGHVATKDVKGKEWYSYYFEHPEPTVYNRTGQIVAASSLKPGQKVNLVLDPDNGITEIRMR